MADSQERSGMFAAISVVSLVFMVIGIAIAVVQWVSYAADLPPGPRTSEEPPSLSSIGSGKSSDDGSGAGAGAGTSGPVEEKPKAGTKGGTEVKPPVEDGDAPEF